MRGFCIMSIAVFPMIFSQDYELVIVCVTLLGIPVPIINSLLLGYVFLLTPQNLQGRVTTTLTVPAQSLSSFSSAIAGTLIQVLSARFAFGIFLIVIVLATIMAFTSSHIRAIPQSSQWDKCILE